MKTEIGHRRARKRNALCTLDQHSQSAGGTMKAFKKPGRPSARTPIAGLPGKAFAAFPSCRTRTANSMKIHCAIFERQIERDQVCIASGNHPLCRNCQGQESKLGDIQVILSKDPGEDRIMQGTRRSATKRKARKRCECGRKFIPKEQPAKILSNMRRKEFDS
jgi:hypothetical protein